ncbi:MAG: GEVED domain-containing protein [Bacteroidia bacterium]|nr:GEVED domain-containing protein [Bacteroidia bacterium]
MKRNSPILLVVLLILWFSEVSAQQWIKNIPQEKSAKENLSFFDIQKAFNDYWSPLDVRKGYYEKDGEKIKAAGWKQFKRWEWFWNDRVDPQSGEFPKTSAFRELRKYFDENPVLKSTTGASTGNWTSIGPTSTPGGYAGLGRLNCVAFSPASTSVIYVGAASGGVWKSIDGGTSWSTASDNNAVLGISDLIVLPGTSGDIIYAATGDRDASDNYSVGVLKSIDGGITWNTTGLNWSQSSLRLIYRLLGDPNNADVLFAATSDGIYMTSDGGNTWLKKSTNQFINIKFKPGSSTVMYGSTPSSGDIFLSTDGGASWSIVLNTAGYRVELAVTPINSEIVYALISNTADGLFGVYKSTTGGTSFTQVFGSSPNMLAWNCDGSDAGGQGWYDLCIAVDPTNADIVFVGGVNTWKSTNGGTAWTISNHWSGTCSGKATAVHADKHYFAYQPGTTTLFECNDGGLYKTSNSGANWTHLGNGLIISQMYRLGVSQMNSGDVIAGLQDNGTKAMISNTWKDVIGGDGMECLIDYTNTNVQYGELYYGDIYRTDNRWGSSTYITGSLTGSAGWVTPYVIDPANSNTLYCGYQSVWKTTNKGSSWTKISSWTGSTLRSLAVAPSSTTTIYAATSSILYRTTNGGISWTNITGTLPMGSNYITYISVKQDDPNTVWVSLGQFNAYGVFQSTDGGATWTDISSGLPSIPVNCVIQNKQSTSQVELYAGTDVGVFIKLGSAGWVPYFTGLPNVVVMELDIFYAADPALSKIRAATYGRGLWESDVYAGVFVNTPPAFKTDPVVEAGATTGSNYSATLVDNVTDPNSGDILSFSLISAPAWLTVAANGALSGIPLAENIGLNSFIVKVDDNQGGTDQAELQITVSAPSYCISKGLSSSMEWIKSVTFNSVINSSANNGGYKDYTAFTFNWNANTSVSFTLTPGFSGSSTNQNWSIWIDFNKDLDFSDPGEQVFTSALKKVAVSGSFTLPAFTGTTRMRISMSDASVPGPCTQFSGGEVEDYTVTVAAVVVLVPIADFSASPVSIFVGQSVQFTDLTKNIPTGWSWNFGDGKTSIAQNPANTYSSAGSFTVTLTATNSAGSNTITKTSYITVTVAPVVTYCVPTGISNSSDYINSLAIGGITSSTGKGSSAYLLYTSPVFSFTAGKSSSVSLTPYKSTNRDYWKIWIDYNLDGDFTDSGENVFNATNKRGTVTGSILIPSTASGLTRMRIAMRTSATMNPCDNNYGGEVEDYSVNIIKTGSIDGGSDIISGENAIRPVMKLYPNPANSQLNISVENAAGDALLHVYNILGSQLDLLRVDSNLMLLDLTKYSRGVYYILLEDQNQRVVQKFIKE